MRDVGNVGSFGVSNRSTNDPFLFNFFSISYQMIPPSPQPLSKLNAYTTWPGGVDPTARLYDSVGGKRKTRAARKGRKTIKSRKVRKSRKH